MEILKILPSDLQKKFKSKRDLYNILSIDCNLFVKLVIVNYHLPPFHWCPMYFMRQVLEGKKEVLIESITIYRY